MGIPIRSAPTQTASLETGAPSTDSLLRAVLGLQTAEEKRQFFEILFARMTLTAKEGVAEVLWGVQSDNSEFDMPERAQLYSDAGIEELLADLEPSGPPTGRVLESNSLPTAIGAPIRGYRGAVITHFRRHQADATRRRLFQIPLSTSAPSSVAGSARGTEEEVPSYADFISSSTSTHF